MSRALFSLNPDLARLRSEGYFMRIQGNLLVMLEVPYVDAQRQVRVGTLSSALDLAGDCLFADRLNAYSGGRCNDAAD